MEAFFTNLGSLTDAFFRLILVVSRAFQILSDSEKKSKYDKFGGDPDNRFSPGASSSSSPFSGFSGFPQGRGGGPMFDEEISPEELFNRFFGGGGFGPFGNKSYLISVPLWEYAVTNKSK